MAIAFKDIDDKLRLSPLNSEELGMIQEVESFIDGEIIKGYNGESIYIDLSIADFRQKLSGGYRNIADPRRILMHEELTRRYEAAGWKCDNEIGDSREMCSRDYWVLKGKKK